MWKPKPKPEDDLLGLALKRWRDDAEIRAILMEEFPDFFDKVVELAEAEAHYQTVKNLKKKDPPTFYEGRNRLYRARQAVDKWGDLFDDPNREHRMRIQEIEGVISKRRLQAKDDAFYEPNAFKAWVRKQLDDHLKAKHQPERVELRFPAHQATAAQVPKVQREIAERCRLYSELWRISQEVGVEAAIQHHKSITRRLLNECRSTNDSEEWHEYPDGNEGWKGMSTFLLSDELRFK
jgi:hypothetical protein